MSTLRRGLVLTSAICLLAAPAAFGDKPGSEWTPLQDPAGPVKISNTNEIGLARTADGVLHVLWVNGRPGNTEALLQTPFTGTDPAHPGTPGTATTVQTASLSLGQSFNDSVDLLRTSTGLRALFARLDPGGPADGVMSTSTSASGAAWTTPVAASATALPQRSPVYAAAGIGGAMGLTGAVYSTWGDSSPDGGGYHVGTSTASPDSPFTPACCELDPNVAVDSDTGEVMVASNLSDTGIRVKSLNTSSTLTVPNSAHAWTQQRTSISGRIGAPGIFVAWGAGDNMFNARPAVWQVGADKYHFLTNQDDAAHVGMTPAPGGRLWVYWDRNGKIYASRTDTQGVHLGGIVKVPGALGSKSFDRLAGEGSLGPLDLFALTEKNGKANWWTERIVPGLTLNCGGPVDPGGKLDCIVYDAGTPIPKIEVFTVIKGKKISDKSNAGGHATLKFPKNAKPGSKAKVQTDAGPAYTDAKVTVQIHEG